MIVLDTHVWIWWSAKPEKIEKKALRAIEKADRIGVAAISVWEVAMKVRSGRLRFDRPCSAWVDQALTDDARCELLHLSPRVAIDATELSWDHADPADRFIVATARAHDALLVTADDRIRQSRLVRCVWD